MSGRSFVVSSPSSVLSPLNVIVGPETVSELATTSYVSGAVCAISRPEPDAVPPTSAELNQFSDR